MVLFVSEGAVGGSGLQVNAQWAFVLSIKYEAQWHLQFDVKDRTKLLVVVVVKWMFNILYSISMLCQCY